MNNDNAIPDFTQINELTNNSSPGPSSDEGESDSWNDKRVVATSVQLLGLLARHLPRAPVLLVITARTVGEELPEAVTDCLARLAREPSTTILRLTGLGEDDVATLLTAQLGSPGDRSLASTVHDRTGGNPFFVVELSRWMVGAHDLHLDSAPVPPSVGDVLRTRLDRLPSDTRDVLELAAVAGREVSLDLLEATGHGGAVQLGTLEVRILAPPPSPFPP